MLLFLFVVLCSFGLETSAAPSSWDDSAAVAKLQAIYRRLERVDNNLAGSQRLVLAVLNRRLMLSDARDMLDRRLSRMYKQSFKVMLDLYEFWASSAELGDQSNGYDEWIYGDDIFDYTTLLRAVVVGPSQPDSDDDRYEDNSRAYTLQNVSRFMNANNTNESADLNLTWWETHGTSTTGAEVAFARAPAA